MKRVVTVRDELTGFKARSRLLPFDRAEKLMKKYNRLKGIYSEVVKPTVEDYKNDPNNL